MRRYELTDAQWEQIAPLLPPQKPRTGRPAEDHCQVLNGMLWILRTGAPWADLPARYGSVETVSSRFYRWRQAGVFDRVLRRLQAQADARGNLDWNLHFVDATVVRAHQHAAGARRSGAIGGRGRSRGLVKRSGAARAGSRPSCTCAPRGAAKPIAAVLTAGERHEQFALDALMDKGALPRRGRGQRACRKPCRRLHQRLDLARFQVLLTV
ncbi:IS5 family transposase [Methylobacterium sp.]|uniref:IS5 family transposase n=1 Tax=Methylobacterium sp. TaxID=409 RepID=UPI0025D53AAC|nr:IS5 family transposase [Methylobacterium sp.]